MSDELLFEKLPYAPGTFESPKFKAVHDAILSYSVPYVEVEGAIRGGKDVNVLACYAEFLMLTPDTRHLVTGVTTDTAKETVLNSDFGIKKLIPHGKEITEDNRVRYVFKDWLGIEKEIHFFGLSNYNDHEKFRGISYGSHYANEATKQNVEGLKVAAGRTISSKWRKIIWTQNPISPNAPLYDEIEKPLIITPEQLNELYVKRTKYKSVYDSVCKEFEKKDEDATRKCINDFMFDVKKSDINFLSKSEQLQLRKTVLLKKYEIRAAREEFLYKNYGISSKLFIYDEGGNNPNDIKNGTDFRYFHFTLEDNPSLTNLQREDAKKQYDPNSLHYRRDILGIRAMAQGAIYDNLSTDNFYYQDLPKNLTQMGWLRIIVVDYGVKNDFVLQDCLIEPHTKTIFIENELRFKGHDKNEMRPATNELYVQMTKDFIKSREVSKEHPNGYYTKLLYDPSALGFANSLGVAGIHCTRAHNCVTMSRRVKKANKMNQDQKTYKESIGIMLVKDGISMHKIKINKKNCKDLVNELESYAFDPKKLDVGIEEPLKINDHGCDCLRYCVNTMIETEKIWKIASNKEIGIEDVKSEADEYIKTHGQEEISAYDGRTSEDLYRQNQNGTKKSTSIIGFNLY